MRAICGLVPFFIYKRGTNGEHFSLLTTLSRIAASSLKLKVSDQIGVIVRTVLTLVVIDFYGNTVRMLK